MVKSDLQELADEIRFRPRLLKEQPQEPVARTVEGFVLVIDFEENQFVKNKYLLDMFNFIKERGKMGEYRMGIKYLSLINKKNLMHELADDMVARHPVAGRIVRYAHHQLWQQNKN